MSDYETIDHSFGPFYDSDSRILILGSFPSVKSREMNFYYGHPQNRFWKILSSIYQDAPGDDIDSRKAFLSRHHIALYDVIDRCDIKDSSDSSIRNAIPTDLVSILNKAPIERIFVNGKASARYFFKYQEETTGRTPIVLPSSSSANAAWSVERLTEEWGRLLSPHLLSFVPSPSSSRAIRFYEGKDTNDGYLDLSGSLPLIRFKSLDSIPYINACFTTKLGGVSKGELASLNLCFGRNDDPSNLAENFSRVASAMGTDLNHIAMSSQVHSDEIKYAPEEGSDDIMLGDECTVKVRHTDGLWTDKKDVMLSTTFADCVPVLLVNIRDRKIANLHSGWKGTVAEISAKGVSILGSPSDTVAVIGPSISGNNYEVTDDVIEHFKNVFPEDEWGDIFEIKDRSHYMLDLWAAIWHTLIRAGVKPANIHFSGICTYENAAILFSHRRSHGKRGNMNAFISML